MSKVFALLLVPSNYSYIAGWVVRTKPRSVSTLGAEANPNVAECAVVNDAIIAAEDFHTGE
jgi:hypothetical protein